MKEIIQRIIEARESYYTSGQEPIMTDAEFDALVDEVTQTDPRHPVLYQVGFASHRDKVPLEHTMYSLEKAKDVGSLHHWLARHPGSHDFIMADKLDGVAVDLVYHQHHDAYYLEQAVTRGDGEVGEDITQLVVKGGIKGFPHVISTEGIGDSFHIYGELVISKKQFQLLNLQQKAKGEEIYTNSRNLVSGTLALVDNLEEVKRRGLEFVAYNTSWSASLVEKYTTLQLWNVAVVSFVSTDDEKYVENYYVKAQAYRGRLPYQVDGLVLSLNSYEAQQRLGYTSHHPRWAVALKFEDETATVMVNEIEWTVSKNGIITPQALFDPIPLGGAMLSRVSLHNALLVADNEIGKGAFISICRSNDVIPKFLLTKERGEPIDIPSACPSCGSEVMSDGPRIRCSNDDGCPAQLSQSIVHLLEALDFKDIGEKCAEKMVMAGLHHPLDLFTLSAEELGQMLSWQTPHAIEVHKRLQDAKISVPFWRFLVMLQVKGLGKTAAKKLAPVIKHPRFLMTGVDLLNICREIIGPNVGIEVHAALKSKFLRYYPIMRRQGWSIVEENHTKQEAKSMVICISGKLTHPRKHYEELIEASSHQFASSITKEVDLLILGDDVGATKISKAKKFGIKIGTEVDLLAIVG